MRTKDAENLYCRGIRRTAAKAKTEERQIIKGVKTNSDIETHQTLRV